MKSKKKKEGPIKFQESSIDSDFESLMNQEGFKKEPKPKNQPTPTKAEPVEFKSGLDWNPHSSIIEANEKQPQKSSYYRKPPAKRRIKIVPGFTPDAELDLHGYTRQKAIQSVEQFLLNSRIKKCRVVLIITGRGLNSNESKGILKGYVREWLYKNKNYYNIEYKQAPAFLGGAGAILVFLN